MNRINFVICALFTCFCLWAGERENCDSIIQAYHIENNLPLCEKVARACHAIEENRAVWIRAFPNQHAIQEIRGE